MQMKDLLYDLDFGEFFLLRDTERVRQHYVVRSG